MRQRSFFILAFTVIGFAPLLVKAEASYLLQLGSFPTEAAAEEKWNSLKDAYESQLSGLDKRITNVPIGGNRSIFRLQAGPLNAKDTASERCASLKAEKQDCYLVETAVLSSATPTQALSSVRATGSVADADSELQFGSDGSENSGLISLDTALPRAAGKNAASAQEENDVAAIAPEVVSPKHSPASLLDRTFEDERAAEATAPTPPLPSDAKIAFADAVPSSMPEPINDGFSALEAPSRASYVAAPVIVRAAEKPQSSDKDSLQSLAQRPDAPSVEKAFVAPPSSPMGSLGTLRLNQQGEVVGASVSSQPVVVASVEPSTSPVVSAPEAAAQPQSVNVQAPAAVSIAPSRAAPAMPTAIALMAPPPASIGSSRSAEYNAPRSAATAPVFQAEPAQYAAASPSQASAALPAPITTFNPTSDSLGVLTPSNAKDVRVEVREAIRVKEQDQPVQPVVPDLPYAPAAEAKPLYTAPAAWRGTPADLPKGVMWAQFGQFVQEDAAFAYFDQLRAARPDLTNGVRVRALRPYSSMGLGRHVALRVGPYRSEADVNALCAEMKAARVPCTSVQEMGLSTLRTERQPELQLKRNQPSSASPALKNPFVAPGNYWVQVGSFNSATDAQNRYSALKAQLPQLFVGVQPNITSPKASSSAKPVHRLRVGGFMDEVAARGFCNSLGQNGIPCLILKQ